MSKTSKQTSKSKQERKVDPNLVRDYADLTSAGRQLAGVRSQPNRGVTIAGMTPAQQQAMASSNLAAQAFGLPTADFAMAPTETSAGGIEGYSIAPEYDRSLSLLPDEYTNAIQDFYDMIGSAFPQDTVNTPYSNSYNTGDVGYRNIDGRRFMTLDGNMVGQPVWERDRGTASRN